VGAACACVGADAGRGSGIASCPGLACQDGKSVFTDVCWFVDDDQVLVCGRGSHRKRRIARKRTLIHHAIGSKDSCHSTGLLVFPWGDARPISKVVLSWC
jgi:hypothetical protein